MKKLAHLSSHRIVLNWHTWMFQQNTIVKILDWFRSNNMKSKESKYKWRFAFDLFESKNTNHPLFLDKNKAILCGCKQIPKVEEAILHLPFSEMIQEKKGSFLILGNTESIKDNNIATFYDAEIWKSANNFNDWQEIYIWISCNANAIRNNKEGIEQKIESLFKHFLKYKLFEIETKWFVIIESRDTVLLKANLKKDLESFIAIIEIFKQFAEKYKINPFRFLMAGDIVMMNPLGMLHIKDLAGIIFDVTPASLEAFLTWSAIT